MKTEELLTDKEQERLEDHFMRFARVDAVPEYWINAKEAGDSYCRECAVKKVEEIKAKEPDNEDISVDGGYGTIPNGRKKPCVNITNGFTHSAKKS